MATEFVSLSVVRELLGTLERTFKQFIEFHMNNVKEEIKALSKYVEDLKGKLGILTKRYRRSESEML